jgi:TPR repeat protein
LGCLNVSIAYGEGRGVPKDAGGPSRSPIARAGAGLSAGARAAGMAKITGDGVTKDVKAGLAQLDATCTRGEPAACESLVKLYSGAGADVLADPLRVREYAKKACDLGEKLSCGFDQVLGTADSAETVAAQWNALFQAKRDAGSAVACGMLGENLLAGIGTSVDRARGTALLERACTGGFDRACKKLAEVRARGSP